METGGLARIVTCWCKPEWRRLRAVGAKIQVGRDPGDRSAPRGRTGWVLNAKVTKDAVFVKEVS